MRRSASRLPRILAAAAAVPALLVVAACSSGSGSGDGSGKDSADGGGSSSAPAVRKSPTVAPAKYRTLPDACKVIDSDTVGKLVPNAKPKGGTGGNSTDINAHGSCAWNGLKDKGVHGSQYRWLEVALTRFDSQAALGSGNSQASKQYATEVDAAQTTKDAKSVMTAPVTGAGDQATSITYRLTKSGEDFSYATVVTRADNVVLSLTYNGAGFEGEKSPSTTDIAKDALSAAKNALEHVEADSDTGSSAGGGSTAPSSQSPTSSQSSKSPSGDKPGSATPTPSKTDTKS